MRFLGEFSEFLKLPLHFNQYSLKNFTKYYKNIPDKLLIKVQYDLRLQLNLGVCSPTVELLLIFICIQIIL